MARSALITCIAIIACVFGAGTSASHPALVPASRIGPSAEPLADHPYKSALAAVGNYQSCGTNPHRTSYLAIEAELRSIEAAAGVKGLGPTLARLRQEYQQLLAVSSMMACAPGPAAALAGARHALRAFRAWVPSSRTGPEALRARADLPRPRQYGLLIRGGIGATS
jgi:hypothetical protein